MTILTGTKKRVVIYCRISQSDDKVGVDRQEKLVRSVIEQHPDWDVVAVLVDNNRSAKEDDLSKRPDYAKLLGMVEMGEVDILASYHCDRISRNGEVVERFLTLSKRHKLVFQPYRGASLDLWTADGQKAFRSTATEAIYESAHKGERVKDRIEEQEDEGMIHGGFRPYGIHRASKTLKDKEGNLLPTEDEDGNRIPQLCPSCGKQMKVTIRSGAVRAVVEQCEVEKKRLKWFAEQWVDGATLYGMAQHANKEGWPTVRGGTWRAETIKTILGNDLSKGKRNGTDHQFGALIPEDLQKALRQAQAVPRKRGKQMTPTLLGGLGILKCGVCGANMQASQKAKNETRYGCIKAPGRDDHCGGISVMRERCDERVRELIVPKLKLWRSKPVNASTDHQRDLEQAKADLEELHELRFEGPVEDRMTKETYTRRTASKRREIEELEAKVEAAKIRSDIQSAGVVPKDPDKINDEWWRDLTHDEKRTVLKDMVAWIKVAPSPAGRIFDPNRVSLRLGDWVLEKPMLELINELPAPVSAAQLAAKGKRGTLPKS